VVIRDGNSSIYYLLGDKNRKYDKNTKFDKEQMCVKFCCPRVERNFDFGEKLPLPSFSLKGLLIEGIKDSI